MKESGFEPLDGYQRLSIDEMIVHSQQFRDAMRRRRTVRDFSSEHVPDEVIESALATAATAPSGANQQPWHFAVVRETETKKAIRIAAEEEERSFYQDRAPAEWLEALAPLGTDDQKPFLETAPVLIAIFAQQYQPLADGKRKKHYYVAESVGIATGLLIASLHLAGLATLTHTPSPMKFLNEILERPSHERPYILLVVGYPSESAKVPRISKKLPDDYRSFH